jgi:hypothetical protein
MIKAKIVPGAQEALFDGPAQPRGAGHTILHNVQL